MRGYGLHVTVQARWYDGEIEGASPAEIVTYPTRFVEATQEVLRTTERSIIAAELGRQVIEQWESLVASLPAEHLP